MFKVALGIIIANASFVAASSAVIIAAVKFP